MGIYETKLLPEHVPQLGEPRNSNLAVPQRFQYDNQQTYEEVMSATERNLIQQVYESSGKNKTETAKKLGISLRNLYYKMQKHSIE